MDFGVADKLYFNQIELELNAHAKLSQRAKSNNIENFAFGVDDIYMETAISRMDQNQEIFKRMMDDSNFWKITRNYMLKKVCNSLNR